MVATHLHRIATDIRRANSGPYEVTPREDYFVIRYRDEYGGKEFDVTRKDVDILVDHLNDLFNEKQDAEDTAFKAEEKYENEIKNLKNELGSLQQEIEGLKDEREDLIKQIEHPEELF
jgi:predicted ribosome quality control (RQC) complex YloA/Tae2 family protein